YPGLARQRKPACNPRPHYQRWSPEPASRPCHYGRSRWSPARSLRPLETGPSPAGAARQRYERPWCSTLLVRLRRVAGELRTPGLLRPPGLLRLRRRLLLSNRLRLNRLHLHRLLNHQAPLQGLVVRNLVTRHGHEDTTAIHDRLHSTILRGNDVGLLSIH